MRRVLDEAMHYTTRLPIQSKLMFKTRRQYERDLQYQFDVVDNIIADRKRNGDKGEKDLLARMLNVVDPETGEKLDDENIRYQIITFLVAGHETTSGVLSFAIYFLLKHPDVLKTAYEEVDQQLSVSLPTYEQVANLKYIRMILNETLRLWPTAPQYSLYAKKDTLIGGKYPIKKGEPIFVLIPQLHRDKEVWGVDAGQFRPERFEDSNKVPSYAYKPFGNGQRACIGMQFALHEATLILGLILRHFTLTDYTNYQLKVKQTLTLKPEDFRIQVQIRNPTSFNLLKNQPKQDTVRHRSLETQPSKVSIMGLNNRPLLVLYGSDMGTSERVARDLTVLARIHGIRSEAASLNERIGRLPKEGAVIIITSSYNGKAPINAKKFIKWVEGLEEEELKGVHYSVFGCGDRNWASTYQQIPRLIDKQLAEKGATRFSFRGEGDLSGDFEKQFEDWKSQMWKDAMMVFDLKMDAHAEMEKQSLRVQFISGFETSPIVRSYQAKHAKVLVNQELQQKESGRSTRHIEIELPEGMTYQEGDHLGIFPINHPETVERILTRFGLKGEDQVLLTSSGMSATHFPLDRPISLLDLLKFCVEIQEPATRSQIRETATYTVCPPHKNELEALLEEGVYEDQILSKRVTWLDLIEKYEACNLPFEKFLECLPARKPRYYSVSSSPELNEKSVSITVAVVREPSWSGKGDYLGVASNYLAKCVPGDAISLFIRTPESGFQLPSESNQPIIMVGPGTGIAPFRGFLQARDRMKQKGRKLGEAHLYFGCRNEWDFLYREELEHYVKKRIVALHTAFSRKENMPKTYVQHLIYEQTEAFMNLMEQGAKLFVCGDGKQMAQDVEVTLIKGYQKVYGGNLTEAKEWLERLQKEGQYVKDVWQGFNPFKRKT